METTMNRPSIGRREFLGACAIAAGAYAAPARAAAAPVAKAPKVVMIAGTPSHGPGDHEFNAGIQLLASCLRVVEDLDVVVQLSGYPKDESIFDGATGIVLYADGGGGHPFIQENRLKTIGKLIQQGVGLMCMHYAVEVPKDKGAEEFRSWIGGCYEHQWSCNPMWSPEFVELPKHPATRGVGPFSVKDEWYFNMRFRPDMSGVTSLLSAKPSDAVRNGPYVYPQGPYPHIQAAKGRAETMMWGVERDDGGRGVGFTGGHVHPNWLDDNYRKIVLNAILWLSGIDPPENGVPSGVTKDELAKNLDPKPAKK